MIPRYSPPLMAQVWTEENKFQTWLKVELAMIKARTRLGYLNDDPNILNRISAAATFTVEAIEARDREIEHDLQAFVDVVRASLPEADRKYFHQDMTSYDTEVPAQAIQIVQAIEIIQADLLGFRNLLQRKAGEHSKTYCMGITHGQDAEPTSFGWSRFAVWLELMHKVDLDLELIKTEAEQIKCSGAVGNYLTIHPDLEAEVAAVLHLEVRPAATQIVARDVHARLFSALAVLAGGIEKMATDLRLLSTSGYAEVREPRKKKQKGSSAMPHKRNPILLERLCGMAILARGYACMGQELIRTWLERDIAHSCVERVILPDAFCIVDYSIQKMTSIISGLEINRERMAENINRQFGCWASENVKSLLHEKGIEPDLVYEFVRDSAFTAMEERQPFYEILWKGYVNGTSLKEIINFEELLRCFDFQSALEKNLPIAFKRLGVDLSEALPSNV